MDVATDAFPDCRKEHIEEHVVFHRLAEGQPSKVFQRHHCLLNEYCMCRRIDCFMDAATNAFRERMKEQAERRLRAG